MQIINNSSRNIARYTLFEEECSKVLVLKSSAWLLPQQLRCYSGTRTNLAKDTRAYFAMNSSPCIRSYQGSGGMTAVHRDMLKVKYNNIVKVIFKLKIMDFFQEYLVSNFSLPGTLLHTGDKSNN